VQYLFPDSRAVYETVWESTVEPDEPQMTSYYSSCVLYSG